MEGIDPTSLHSLSVDAMEERIANMEAQEKPKGKGGKMAQRIKDSEKPSKSSKAPAASTWGGLSAADTAKELRDEVKQAKVKEEQLEEDAAKTKLLDQIEAYRARFKHLKKRNKCDNMKASLPELMDEVHYIESQLGHKDGKEPVGMAFVACMYGMEYANSEFNPLGLNLAGLGQSAQLNLAKFQDTLDEIAIKYGMKMNASAEVRLAVMVSTMVLTVNEANNGGGPISQAMGTLQKAQQSASKTAPKVDPAL